jgi:glycosyltransferase involved in cell wall biosynthesis
VDDITAAMQMLVQDGTVRSHLRAAGLERANQFRWEKTAEKTAAVLQQFL